MSQESVAPSKSVAISSPPSAEKKHSNSLAIFALLLSLAALIASGFTWYYNQIIQVKKNSGLAVGITQINGNINRVSDTLNALQKHHDNIVTHESLEQHKRKLSNKINDKIVKIDSRQTQLQDKFDHIKKSVFSSQEKLNLQEVKYLLRLANQTIAFNQDIISSTQLLQLADSLLQKINNPTYIPVRKKIQAEIHTLKNTPLTDTEKVTVTLRQIAQSIPSLSLINEPPINDNLEETPQKTEPQQRTWKDEIKHAWSDLIGAISIQKVGTPPKPLLAPSERYFLNENLRLSLAKAEFAVLRKDQASYDASLAQSIEWLNDFFDLKTHRAEQTVTTLKQLQKVQLATTIPSISGSYQLLQTLSGDQ